MIYPNRYPYPCRLKLGWVAPRPRFAQVRSSQPVSDTPNLLYGGLGFRYGKNSPLLAHFVRNSPPLFAFVRLRSGLKTLTRADCYAPLVFHTWGTRVGFAYTSWFCFAKLLRSVGRGVRRPPRNFIDKMRRAGLCNKLLKKEV